jgi:hypothetical protein
MQLVFGRDFNIYTKFVADWNYIRQRKQQRIHENNRRENARRNHHKYKLGDLVLLRHATTTKFGNPEFEDTPYPITAIYDNGTVQLNKGKYYERVNIRQIKPYKSPAP